MGDSLPEDKQAPAALIPDIAGLNSESVTPHPLHEHSSITTTRLYIRSTAASPCCLAQDIMNKTTMRTSPSSQVSVTVGNKSCQVWGVSVRPWNPLEWAAQINVITIYNGTNPWGVKPWGNEALRVSGFWVISDYPGSRPYLFSGSIEGQWSKRDCSARLKCWQVSNA